MDAATMPWSVGIRFSHAALQALAEDHGVDLLHIKGPAVDESLGGGTRRSIDADVLVRPAHVDTLLAAMHEHGWSTRYLFEDGSAFEHAATLGHPFLAPVDVHRSFPGIGGDAAAAFERLWADRHDTDIAGMPCPVPSVAAQRLILIVHATRGGRLDHPDIERSWTSATSAEREAVIRLADDLGAGVALAAGTGRLDEFVGQRGHELWRVLSTGEQSRARIWAARVRAAPTRRAALRVAVRLVVPNRHRMEARLGRRPTAREVATAYVTSARAGTGELVGFVRDAAVGRRGR
ncbi:MULTISPECIES: nucleotidyltransferase family protein [unclassified Knoellia]|uniref:nucleotidyltransferase family protein n=1 Tax=Knoellia altitudinis TaxID=3404795 RepID=UPI00361CA300